MKKIIRMVLYSLVIMMLGILSIAIAYFFGFDLPNPKKLMTSKYYVQIKKNGRLFFSYLDKKTKKHKSIELDIHVDNSKNIQHLWEKYDCKRNEYQRSGQTYVESNCWFGRYSYKMEAYNKEGEKIRVRFKAGKNLRLGAFLVLHVLWPIKNGEDDEDDEFDGEVNSIYTWEEVSYEQLSLEAKKRF